MTTDLKALARLREPFPKEQLKRCGGDFVESEFGACVCPIYQHEDG